jgi:hypothetical protein
MFDYYSQPDGLRLGSELGLTEKQEHQLRAFTWDRVVKGDNDLDTYLDWATHEFPQLEKKVLTQAFDTVLPARRAQIASWPAETRSTPLMTAFAELADLGILARGNFTCCGSCASLEIWDERDDSRTWRGYIYFHSQDAERIPEDRTTYVGYGLFIDAYLPEWEWDALSKQAKDDTYTRLVRELMAEATIVLERHGVEVEWDGDLKRRILLKNVDWYIEV